MSPEILGRVREAAKAAAEEQLKMQHPPRPVRCRAAVDGIAGSVSSASVFAAYVLLAWGCVRSLICEGAWAAAQTELAAKAALAWDDVVMLSVVRDFVRVAAAPHSHFERRALAAALLRCPEIGVAQFAGAIAERAATRRLRELEAAGGAEGGAEGGG